MRNIYPLIYQDWDDYEQKKKENGQDPSLFSCNDVWELFYLEKKIHTVLPHIERIIIFETIDAYCRDKTNAIPRLPFIDNIMRTLMIVEKLEDSNRTKNKLL